MLGKHIMVIIKMAIGRKFMYWKGKNRIEKYIFEHVHGLVSYRTGVYKDVQRIKPSL